MAHSPPTVPPFLLGRGNRLNLVERACNRNWHRTALDGVSLAQMAPPTAPPILLARYTPLGRGYRLNLVERACNRNCHGAAPDG
ncbi:hypothetical protein CEXT_168241 [Caerostris extrusa]|uniref:Uncharacterized protein n=1 Tax=Caerostris extrusa TaxID=172846 RepID=A0AAV4Q6K2_CAEEX|nr:hypothetical protein CEXT_168241 [Caerostris extrusa]